MLKKLFTLLTISLITIFVLVSCAGGSSTDPLSPPENTDTTVTHEEWTKAITLEGYDSFTFDWTASFEEIEDSVVEESTNGYGTFKYDNLNFSENGNNGYREIVKNDTLSQKPSNIADVIDGSSIPGDFVETLCGNNDIFNYENFEYDENTKAYTYTYTDISGPRNEETHDVKISIYFSDKALYSIVFSESISEDIYDWSCQITSSFLFSDWNTTTVE